MQTSTKQDFPVQIGRGIAFKLIALAIFTIMASLIKATADVVPPGESVFFRSAFSLPVIIVWLIYKGDLSTGLRTRNPMGHVWRGVIGVSSMGLGFTALGLLPLPEVTAIGFASPLITVVLAAVLLGERVRLFRLTAVGIGLVGVMVILWPRLDFGVDYERLAMVGAVCALISAALRSLAQVHIRKLVQSEHPSAVVFYFMLTASLLSLLTMPFGWVLPGALDIAMLIGAGVFGGVAQIFLTMSYRFAPASVLAPFDYASMLFAVFVGYFVFTEIPTIATLIGSGIVMMAGALIIWRERQLGIQRGKARSKLTPMG